MADPNTGLVILYTGSGKGKTTAALGLALRAVGQKMSVRIVEFLKGPRQAGELEAAKRLAPDLAIETMGLGFYDPDDPSQRIKHQAAARRALARAADLLRTGDVRMVVLDEVNMAVHYGLLEASEVLQAVRGRAPGVHVVLTGRDAPHSLIDQADLVSEIVSRKHPFDRGQNARPGIEY